MHSALLGRLSLLVVLAALISYPALRTLTAVSISSQLKRSWGSLPAAMPEHSTDVTLLRENWRKKFAELPSTPDNIPSFFLAHGQPMIVWPKEEPIHSGGRLADLQEWQGRDGPLGQFLDDFGPVLIEKYNPKGIVVFSAHWETSGERLVTDYGDENPLLMDYYGFPPSLYKIEFHSKGSSEMTQRVIQAFEQASQKARATLPKESRGRDGRGFMGPGLDHGVFVPFKRMFGDRPSIPIVEVSIDKSLDPEKHWEMGRAMTVLRKEGYLVIAGGLPVHSFSNWEGFSIHKAQPLHKEFDLAVSEAVAVQDPVERKAALKELVKHPGFRLSHDREDHFIPLYVAAGAGEFGGSMVLSDIYAQSSFAFGL